MKNQVSILSNFSDKFKEMCKYFNVEVKELPTSGNHAFFEFLNKELNNRNTAREELLFYIKDIYEKELLGKS